MRVTGVIALLSASLLIGGCVSVTYGVQPQVDRLARLSPGKSRQSDVLLTLGEPRGKGAAHLSAEIPLRDVWFYEFAHGEGGWKSTSVDLEMLVVFFQGGVYDGYLWFSSVDKMKPTKSGIKPA